MKSLFIYRSLILSFILSLLPAFALLVPGIKSYVINNFMVAAVYNSVIIFIYILGSMAALFSTWQSLYSKNIIKTKNSSNQSSLLANINKKLFSENNKTNYRALLKEISGEINMTRSQRVSFITNCSNVSTLIGLLGTFAGLSVTISGIGSMLSKSSASHHLENSSDTLQMIINTISSLSEPLRGMNVAFVSSIYGVVCAILLIAQSVFVRSAFSQLSGELKRYSFENFENTPTRVRTIRVESPVVSEFKKSFEDFCQQFTRTEENKIRENSEHHQKLLETLCELYRNIESKNQQVSEQSAVLQSVQLNQKVLINQTTESGKSISEMQQQTSKGLKDLQQEMVAQQEKNAHQNDTLIEKTEALQAEVESYKATFIPLLEKITSMYQNIVKKTVLTKRYNNEK